MARKVILDVDPGIDDLAALCLALFDPNLEVLAVTAVSGAVPAEQTTKNLLGIIELLDPPRRPRIGAASEPEHARPADLRNIYGPTGLGDADLEVAELHHMHASAKVICEVVRADPGDVTIICLGPLTNIAAALRRDAELPYEAQSLFVRGGVLHSGGNATPAAEFNIYCDPKAAREVFHGDFNLTLLPLDVTELVNFSADDIASDDFQSSRAGQLLSRTLPFAFRAYHEQLGMEGLPLHDTVGVGAFIEQGAIDQEEAAGDVEITGEITMGATIVDRGSRHDWPLNLNVATSIDAPRVKACVLNGFRRACQAT